MSVAGIFRHMKSSLKTLVFSLIYRTNTKCQLEVHFSDSYLSDEAEATFTCHLETALWSFLQKARRVDTFKGSCWLQRVEIIVLWNCPSVFFLLLFIIFSKIVYNYSSGLIPNIYGGS